MVFKLDTLSLCHNHNTFPRFWNAERVPILHAHIEIKVPHVCGFIILLYHELNHVYNSKERVKSLQKCRVSASA